MLTAVDAKLHLVPTAQVVGYREPGHYPFTRHPRQQCSTSYLPTIVSPKRMRRRAPVGKSKVSAVHTWDKGMASWESHLVHPEHTFVWIAATLHESSADPPFISILNNNLSSPTICLNFISFHDTLPNTSTTENYLSTHCDVASIPTGRLNSCSHKSMVGWISTSMDVLAWSWNREVSLCLGLWVI